MQKQRHQALIFKIVLLLFSLVIGLLVCEVALRILKPELGELVNSERKSHSYRIFANPVDSWRLKLDPDTHQKHLAIYNKFGSRQHREFAVKKPEGTYRIALCGDSYTVNSGVPVPYSFSEPLDYLLNQAGRKAEVLNFGTGGYGTDQIYLQYKDTTENLDLDAVLYVCCWNDFIDIIVNNLFELEEDGELHYIPRPEPSLGKRFVRQFYLTYFLLSTFPGDSIQNHQDVAQEYGRDVDGAAEKLAAQKEEARDAIYRELTDSPDGKKAEALTKALLSEWKRLAESRGQDFYIVFLPRDHRVYTVQRKIAAELGLNALDLFEAVTDDQADVETLFFKTDLHWNAEGNKYGAVHLFKFLTEQQGWENPGNDFIRRTLSEYYDSFDPDYVSESWLLENYPGAPPETREQIRERYIPLEQTIETDEEFNRS